MATLQEILTPGAYQTGNLVAVVWVEISQAKRRRTHSKKTENDIGNDGKYRPIDSPAGVIGGFGEISHTLDIHQYIEYKVTS